MTPLRLSFHLAALGRAGLIAVTPRVPHCLLHGRPSRAGPDHRLPAARPQLGPHRGPGLPPVPCVRAIRPYGTGVRSGTLKTCPG
ncbi:MAG: hypothetical protein INF48_05305 [Rhodobacter sp.]|nr:hypothetical protein [Rhodobacter sp.]